MKQKINKIIRLRSRQAGFTLVELLVVIAIIGILSTVAVVNLNAARTKAKTAAGRAWVNALIPAANLCDYNNGQLTPFVMGTPLCTTLTDINWPETIPDGFELAEIFSIDSTPGDGNWFIQADAVDPIHGWACSPSGCHVP